MNALILSQYLTPEISKSTKPALASAESAKLKAACQDFESVFFGMMLKEMRKTVPQDTLIGDDAHEQEMFQGMMDDAVAKQMAAHSGSDSLIAEMYRQLSPIKDPSSEPEPSTQP